MSGTRRERIGRIARRLGRWAVRGLVVLVVALVVLRAALPIILPRVVSKVAAAAGLACTYEDLSLSVFGGSVALDRLDVRPVEGGASIVTLDRLEADIDVTSLLGTPRVRLAVVDSLHVDIERGADGKIPVLERILQHLGPPKPKPPASPAEPAPPKPVRVPIAIDQLRVDHLRIHVRDSSVTPTLDARLDLHVRVNDINTGVPRAGVFEITAACPPVLEVMRIEGTARPASGGALADFTVEVAGLATGPLRGYLRALAGKVELPGRIGLAMRGRAAVFAGAAAGSLDGDLAIEDLAVSADAAQPLAMERMTLAFRGLRPGGVEVRRLAVAGFRAAADPFGPPVGLTVERFELRDALLDPSRPPATATFEGLLGAPGLAETIIVSGTAIPTGAEIGATVALRVEGIAPRAIAPLLRAKGIEPVLERGSLGLRASVRLAGGAIDAEVRDLAFREGDLELAGIDRVHVRTTGPLTISDVEVVRPRARLWRDRTGALRAMGFVIGPPPPPPSGSAPAPVPEPVPVPVPDSPQPRIRLDRLAVSSVGLRFDDEMVSPAVTQELVGAGFDLRDFDLDLSGEAPPSTAPFKFHASVPRLLDALDVEGTIALAPKGVRLAAKVTADAPAAALALEVAAEAALAPGSIRASAALTDIAVRGPIDLRASVRIDDLVMGRDAKPGRLAVSVAAPPLLDELKVAGDVGVTPITAKLRIDGRAGTRSFGASVDAALERGLSGGNAAKVGVTGIAFRDGELIAATVETVRLSVPRLDPGAGRIEIDELAVLGTEVRVELPKKRPAAPGDDAAKPAPAPAPRAPESDPPPPAGPPPKLPLVEIRTLRFEAREIVAPGVRVHGLTVANIEPLSFLGPDPTSRPPLAMRLEAVIEPHVDKVVVDMRLAPFANDLEADAHFEATGIHALDGASARGEGSVVMRTGRRSPLDFSYARGFGADIELSGCEVRAREGGPVVAGVTRVGLDVAHVDPKTGDTRIRSLEIERPSARVVLEEGGLRMMGKVFPLPVPPTPTAGRTPAPAPATVTAAVRAGPEIRIDRLSLTDVDFAFADITCVPAVDMPIAGLSLEATQITSRQLTSHDPVRFEMLVRGGKIGTSGLVPRSHGLKLDTVAAPTETTAVDEAAKIAAAMAANRGLPFDPNENRRIGSADRLGFTGDRSKEPPKARLPKVRPAFEEITLRGELALAPRPLGSITVGVVGLDLANLGGAASRYGVKLEKGVFDFDASTAISPTGALSLRSSTLLTDLEVDEPENGAVRAALSLPAPLSLVIFALRDDGGTISLPLEVDVPAEGIGRGALAREASAAFLKIVGRALANVPLRAVGGVGKGLLSVTGAFDQENLDPVSLPFAAGDAALPPGAAEAIAGLVSRAGGGGDEGLLLSVRHDFGAVDLERTRVIASPDMVDRRALIARLDLERSRLEAGRADDASKARSALALGLDDVHKTAIARVSAAERELAHLDRALDAAYALVRDGAEREADRRTRTAATRLADARLERVRALLVAAGWPAGDRLRVARPRIPDTPAAAGGITISVTRKRGR